VQRKPNTSRSFQRTTFSPALELPPDRAFVAHDARAFVLAWSARGLIGRNAARSAA
jgi:hypothetical protein